MSAYYGIGDDDGWNRNASTWIYCGSSTGTTSLPYGWRPPSRAETKRLARVARERVLRKARPTPALPRSLPPADLTAGYLAWARRALPMQRRAA